MANNSAHYDEAYFAFQHQGSDLRGKANAFKFEEYLNGAERVLDFGCGGGTLLLAMGYTDGVEINPSAAESARNEGLTIYPSLDEIEDAAYDAVISNHCLEHVPDPLTQLEGILRVLKPGGKAIIVVPCERPRSPYLETDINFHLFSWSAGNLGNLMKVAGFNIQAADEIRHTWPPKWETVIRKLGWGAFHTLSRLYNRLDRAPKQVRVIATKPVEV